jgi:Carboxypeptidase regulatory-like domain
VYRAVPSLRIAPRFLLFAALFYALALPSSAQREASVTGQPGGPRMRSIEGTVLSSTGVPVPGAIVLLKNGKTLQVRSFIAQQDGSYRFYGLSTDVNWELRAESNGMTSKTKTVSVFDSHAHVRLNLKLVKKMKT